MKTEKYKLVSLESLLNPEILDEDFYLVYRNYYVVTVGDDVVFYKNEPFGNENEDVCKLFSLNSLIPYENVKFKFVKGPMFIKVNVLDFDFE